MPLATPLARCLFPARISRYGTSPLQRSGTFAFISPPPAVCRCTGLGRGFTHTVGADGASPLNTF